MYTDNDIKEAVIKVQQVPGWRQKVADLMYASVDKVTRIQHNKLKQQHERRDFLIAINNILHNETAKE
jgi:hypothetical protein